MTLEVLSEEEIEECSNNLRIYEKLSFNQSKKAINTIKLQRQQLAEQECKIRQECLQEFIMLFIKPDQHSAMMYSKAQYELLVKRILKPESEASGE